ncbi:hypothetical protein GC176_24470 [bacterium]|nr:hypothetical protein [bacterium]
MDKLQPIIKHHFWILFLLALILPPIAWSMTTGTLNEQTQTRVDDLDKTLSGVASGAGAPNDDWTKAATQLVNVRKESNRRAWNRLWDIQSELQIWPATVRPYMVNCPYRGTPADLPNISPTDAARVMATVPNLFRGDYEQEIERVWKIPEPKSEVQGLKADPGAPQKVLFPSTVIPRVPRAKWLAAQPTWKEMWNAQEDLWLMSELLKAIRRVNAGTTSITDANVRHIRLIQLFGGERAAAGSSSSNATGGSDSGSSVNPYANMMGGRPTAGGAGPAAADFPLSEEYTVKDAPAGTGAGFGAMMGSAGAEGSSGSPTPSEANDPQADENRYIKQEWAYRTRGFKLQLSVHQMYVPELMAELLKSDFPVDIVRFQQSALNPDRPGSNRTGGYGAGSYATAGSYPGPSGYPGSSGFPGASFPGSGGAYPAGSEDPTTAGTEGSGSYPGTEGAFNPYNDVASGAGGAAAAKNADDSAVVAAALSDIDLLDVVIVGEIYLYNKPEVPAEGDGGDAVAEQAAGTEAAFDPASAGLPAGPAPGDVVTAEPNAGLAAPNVGVIPGSPATLTGEVTDPNGNPPATLESTVLPAEGPAGTTPAASVPTGQPSTPVNPAAAPVPSVVPPDNAAPAAGTQPAVTPAPASGN